MGYKHVLWVKAVPLKVNIFVWRFFFLNRILTKNNFVRRHILAYNDAQCLSDCGYLEDRDRFIFSMWFLWLIMKFNFWLAWFLKGSSFRMGGMGGFFNHKADLLHSLAENKIQIFWWLRLYYALFDLDYLTWKLNPLSCLKAIFFFFPLLIGQLCRVL